MVQEAVLMKMPGQSQSEAPKHADIETRLRTCEECRRRKMRCTGPGGDSTKGSCSKCYRANRECVFRARAKIQHEKTFSYRMKELEVQVSTLTTYLQEQTPSKGHQDKFSTGISVPANPDMREPPCVSRKSTNASEYHYAEKPAEQVLTMAQSLCTGKRSRLWRRPHGRSSGGCSVCRGRKLKVRVAQNCVDLTDSVRV
jgi:hypothetical protein